jgi:Domain of unknown function (DUF4340)
MLTRFHKVLLGALVVQLILVVIVLTRSDDNAALKERALLPGFDVAKVTRVQVFANGEAKAIDLVKRDASWVLASSFDYPVDPAKVTDLLTPLAKVSAAAPLATQAGRHKQLRVADGDFERKLIITRDGKDLTVFIGSSAGIRRAAFRIGGDDKVYAVTGISATTAGNEPRLWVDPSYVKIPRDEIAKLVVQRDGTTVELTHSPTPPTAGGGAGGGSAAGAGSGSAGAGSGSAGAGSGSAGAGSGSAGAGSGSAAEPPPGPPAADKWWVSIRGTPVTFAAGESLDDATIDRLASGLGTLDLSAPADPKRDASKPTATITIERKAGTSTVPPTVLDVILDGDLYWVRDRSLPRAVLIDKSRLDELVKIDRDKVVKKPAPPAPATPPTPPGGLPPGFPPGMPGMGSAARPPGAPVSPH